PTPRPDGRDATDSAAPPPPSASAVVASLESAMVHAIARAEPSVVAIHRDKAPNVTETRAVRGWKPPVDEPQPPQPRFRTADPDDGDFISFDYGSGVVIGDHGEILTAFHVVRGAVALVVHAAGGQSFRAEVIAADPRGDLAVIVPVVEPGAEAPHLRPVAIGDSSRLRKGSFVLALGNPFNAARQDGSASASWGIVSNFARRLDARVDPRSGRSLPTMLQEFPTLLQLDARLNLGMSGGAVINLQGELVGLTTTASSPAGFDAQAGYAIPMDRTSRRAIDRLRRGEEVEYGLLGIVPDETRSNRVFQVSPNSPAARGDLQVDDEIIAVNGVPVTDFHSLIVAVNVYGPGEVVKVKIRRGSATLERTIVLGKFPVQGEIIATTRPKPWRGIRVDYTSSRGLTSGLVDLGIMPGVLVTEVEPGSPAEAAGIRRDVVINKVGGRPILTPRQFAEAVAGRDDPVELETSVGPRTVEPRGDAPTRPPAPPRAVLDR
ncbi:MAG: trypsin-like peptidase domain-containing protein, partial [Isosphaeraceae bacterium]